MRLRQRRSGQAQPEYIIIIVLVAMALVGANRLFGQIVKDKYLGANSTLAEGTPTGSDGNARNGNGGGRNGGGGGGGGEEEQNPYEWDARAQRWYNPQTGYYVAFSAAGRYVDDPYMYYNPALEPSRRRGTPN